MKKNFKLYDVLTNPKVVGKAGLIGVMTYIVTLLISLIIALIVTPGFNIITFTISALGGVGANVAPWLIDIGFVVMAIGLVPVVCYLDQLLAPYPEKAEDIKNHSRTRSRLGSYGTLFMTLGLIGIAGVGIFSVDNNPHIVINYFYSSGDSVGLHIIFSWIAMASITIGGIFFGLIIVLFKDTIFPKLFGLYMIFVPIVPFMLLWFVQPLAIFEWLLQFSFLGWMFPGGFILAKHFKEERGKN